MHTPRLQHAYYSAFIETFLRHSPQTILGHLAQHHPHDLDPLTRNSWLAEIEILQRELASLSEGWLALEFAIPRMGRRADAIVLLKGVIFVIEFKIGATDFDSGAVDQTIDYCLDLKNFHEGSHARPLVPVVIATRAVSRPGQLPFWPDDIAKPILTNGVGLARAMLMEAARFSKRDNVDVAAWMASGYKPTPTIIEAAQALYSNHHVEEITRSDADKKNLTQTTDRLSEIIADAKREARKVICFVTGVPGAGKTLAGLNLAVRYANREGERAVFLSGNDPLVEVLREALARDEVHRLRAAGRKVKVEECRRKVKSFIQNIHHFRDANLIDQKAPFESIAIFDEAQRAWDARQLSGFMARKKGIADFNQSEPSFLIDIFARHKGWGAIVCLVGGGQEINAGEAGLPEWFSAIAIKHRDWKIYVSDRLESEEYRWGRNLSALLEGVDYKIEPDLHLAVAIRSFRAENVSAFVNAIISGDAPVARGLHRNIKDVYPVFLTRDLTAAKAWLREQARGSERCGLVAYSGASRLKSDGINVHEKIDAATWFLNGKLDVRSSYYLEDPATEFDIQGLELDWVGICWEANLRRNGDRWAHYHFRGTEWQVVRDAVRQTYLANAYRVLLTRARQGMVIYVPPGNAADPTRSPEFYDGIADYLAQCGIASLAAPANPVARYSSQRSSALNAGYEPSGFRHGG
jgi:hypothetical protein